MRLIYILLFICIFQFSNAQQSSLEDDMGAWYMYFYDVKFGESKWGVQGDLQFRNWNYIGDLEQLLLRSGITYRPFDNNTVLTLGYGNITTGERGDSNETVSESRIYQEVLIPNKVSSRIGLKHRFRYEQRWVEDQDFRTRFRYNLFLTVPITNKTMQPKTVYLSMYNELFVNGQKEIGNNRMVEYFDRNRFYAAIGYQFSKGQKVQLGLMNQTLNNSAKNQIQLSLHSNW